MKRLFRISVFISYSHADGEWVEELARELSTEFEVFLDKWGIVPGLSWRRQLEKAMRRSSAGIVVLSPDAVESGAVDAEITVLFQKALQERCPLIPILYRDCDIPEFLTSLQYIDFRDQSQTSRDMSLVILRKALHGEPPGSTVELPSKRPGQRLRFSLRHVLISALSVSFIPLLIMGIDAIMQRKENYTYLRETQQEVQSIDQWANLRAAQDYRIPFDGERKYHHPDGNYIVANKWTNGKLKWRSYYHNDRLIARDEFRYAQQEIVEKVRSYMSFNQQLFLVDHFTQDGVLTQKKYFREGRSQHPVIYIDDMRSPLPPPGIVFYR